MIIAMLSTIIPIWLSNHAVCMYGTTPTPKTFFKKHMYWQLVRYTPFSIYMHFKYSVTKTKIVDMHKTFNRTSFRHNMYQNNLWDTAITEPRGCQNIGLMWKTFCIQETVVWFAPMNACLTIHMSLEVRSFTHDCYNIELLLYQVKCHF